MTDHPTCPKCRMEVLRLVQNGRRCDWCAEKPGMGRPFDARNWPSMVEALNRRVAEQVAEADRSAA